MVGDNLSSVNRARLCNIMTRHNRREPLARDLVTGRTDALSDEDLFDWLASLNREHDDPDSEALDQMWAYNHGKTNPRP